MSTQAITSSRHEEPRRAGPHPGLTGPCGVCALAAKTRGPFPGGRPWTSQRIAAPSRPAPQRRNRAHDPSPPSLTIAVFHLLAAILAGAVLRRRTPHRRRRGLPPRVRPRHRLSGRARPSSLGHGGAGRPRAPVPDRPGPLHRPQRSPGGLFLLWIAFRHLAACQRADARDRTGRAADPARHGGAEGLRGAAFRTPSPRSSSARSSWASSRRTHRLPVLALVMAVIFIDETLWYVSRRPPLLPAPPARALMPA